MSAQAASGPATPEQLDLLSKYLCSERAPPTCMLISQLDGFLTGIAAGPQRLSGRHPAAPGCVETAADVSECAGKVLAPILEA